MTIRAEVRCLNCSRLLAEFLGESEKQLALEELTCPTGEPCLTRNARGYLVCTYCGGKPMLEDIQLVTEAVQQPVG